MAAFRIADGDYGYNLTRFANAVIAPETQRQVALYSRRERLSHQSFDDLFNRQLLLFPACHFLES